VCLAAHRRGMSFNQLWGRALCGGSKVAQHGQVRQEPHKVEDASARTVLPRTRISRLRSVSASIFFENWSGGPGPDALHGWLSYFPFAMSHSLIVRAFCLIVVGERRNRKVEFKSESGYLFNVELP
jgi:hypothetical protein